MKVIYNKIIPFRGFYAITVLWCIFVREEYKGLEGRPAYNRMLRHEGTHEAQILDFTPSCFNYYVRMVLGAIPFYLIYFLEWLVRLPINKSKAYNNISFEKEAYDNQYDTEYLATRKRFAQWRKALK